MQRLQSTSWRGLGERNLRLQGCMPARNGQMMYGGGAVAVAGWDIT